MKAKIDIKSMMIGAALGTAVVLATAADSNNSAEVLRVRKLVIVDEQGAERIVIAAPLPNPQMKGKQVPRRNTATGIQINDESGNERGGIVMLDDGSFMVGIDDENSNERAHLYYIPNRGSGVFLQDGQNRAHTSLLIPTAGEHPGRPEFEMTDETGKTIVRMPESK
jgi:hypothetical protein